MMIILQPCSSYHIYMIYTILEVCYSGLHTLRHESRNYLTVANYTSSPLTATTYHIYSSITTPILSYLYQLPCLFTCLLLVQI